MFKVHIPLLTEHTIHVGVQDTGHDREHDREHDDIRLKKYNDLILEYCVVPRSRNEIMDYLGLTARRYFFLQILKPLVESNKILLTIPDKTKSKYQKYITNNK